MSYNHAKVHTLLNHLQALEASNADISAYPDADELINKWGIPALSVGRFYRDLRKLCPKGFMVPHVCHETNMKVIIVQANSILFWRALGASITSVRYCRTRLLTFARDYVNMGMGYPANSQMRRQAEEVNNFISGVAGPYGGISMLIERIPQFHRGAALERAHLRLLADKALAVNP